MAVLTISREFGSVGDDFSAQVARCLNYHYVDKTFISELLEQYGLLEFESEYEARPGFWKSLAGDPGGRRSAMVSMLNQVAQAVAYHGNVVIQGRSGFVILAGFADVLNVRLQAPLHTRITNVSMSHAISFGEAAELVRRADEARTGFVERFYGVSWSAMGAFDLVVNTAKVAPEDALRLIVDGARSLLSSLRPGEPSVASISVDPVLGGVVSKQLGCSLLHR